MREDDINLLQKTPPKKKIEKTLSTSTWAIFIVIFVFGAFMLGISLYLSSRSDSLLGKINDLRADLQASSEKKDKMLITAERLTSIKTVLTTKTGVEGAASLVYSIIPENLSVDGLEADSKEIKIVVSGSDLGTFNVFLQETIEDFISKNKPLIKSVTVDAFQQGSGGYELSLMFKLNEGRFK